MLSQFVIVAETQLMEFENLMLVILPKFSWRQPWTSGGS